MPLTSAQFVTLKNDILADPILNAQPRDGDGDFAIAAAYNALATPDFLVWNPTTPVRVIMDTFNFSAFTPADTVPESNVDQASLQRFLARILVVQTKQMNLQLMLQGRDTVDATLANFRSGLRDALIGIPAGVAGASVVAAGASASAALSACTRKATRAEKLFSGNPVTTGSVSAAITAYTEQITPNDIAIARNS